MPLDDLKSELPPLELKSYKNPTAIFVCSGCATGCDDYAEGDVHEGCRAEPKGKFVWWLKGDFCHFERTGDCVCHACKRRYSRHPFAHGPAAEGPNGQPWLRRLCDGRLVKL